MCVLLGLKQEKECLTAEIGHFQHNIVTSLYNLQKNAQVS